MCTKIICFDEYWQVTQLETKLSKEMSDRAQILQSLEEERTQVAALKVSHSDLLVRLQDLQAQHAKIESQLQTIQQVETSVMLYS
jgi:chromosome segregation ATPase